MTKPFGFLAGLAAACALPVLIALSPLAALVQSLREAWSSKRRG